MIDPDKTFKAMEDAAEKLSEAIYEYVLVDEDKKSVLAIIELRQSGSSQAEIERKARAQDEWREYIKGLATARRNYERAKAHYNNICALNENRRSKEATERYLINRG